MDLETHLINALIALAIFIVGRWAAGLIANLFKSSLERHGTDPLLVAFGANVVRIGLLAFVVIAALGQLGVQTTSFVAVVGAAGLAIALAFQSSLSNLAAGVLLVTFRPFKLGDFIEAGGTSGVVEKIEIFTTQLRSGDNKTIIVPNGAVLGSNVVNYSTKDTRRVDLVVGVSYEDDIDHVKRVLEEIMANDSRILPEPPPTIGVLELADSSVNFAVRPWVASGDYWPTLFDLNETIKKRFDSEKISIPYPQTDVHLRSEKAA